MVYRFKLVSDEVTNFFREIEIDSENTFLQLRNVILESVDYTKDELDSFFLCNDGWERMEEITLEDMGNSSSDRDIWIMENTEIGELIEDEGQKLVFEFDYLTERSFFMELKEIIPSRSLVEPICTTKLGKAPKQSIDMEEFSSVEVKPTASDVDIEDIDPYNGTSFNEEDLDGLDIMSVN
jgi:hypothetical protein